MTILGEPQEFERPVEKRLLATRNSISEQATIWIREQSNSGTITKCLDLNELIKMPQLQFVKFSDTLRR
jgi:hypothetical protein